MVCANTIHNNATHTHCEAMRDPFPLEDTHVNKSIQVSKFMCKSEIQSQCKCKCKTTATENKQPGRNRGKKKREDLQWIELKAIYTL